MIVRGSSFPLGFIASVLLARYLGITELGIYSEALAWGSVVAILGTFGLDRYAVREISGQSAKNSWAALNSIVRLVPKYALLASGAVAAAALVLVLISKGTNDSNGFKTFAIAIVMAPLMSLAILRQGMLQGLGKVVVSRLPEDFLRPAVFIVFLLTAFGIVNVEADSALAMALQAVALVVSFAFGLWLLRSNLPLQLAESVTEPLPARLLREAIPLGLFAAVSILMTQIDVILLGLISDPDQVAIYATTFKIALIVSLAELAVDNAYQPLAASMIATGEHAEVKRFAPRAGLAALLLSIPIAIPLLVFAGPILSIFGPEFVAGETTLRILCASFVLSLLFGQNGTLLMMSRNMKPLVMNTAFALLINIALNLALVPSLDAKGAAVAWLITVAAWNFLLAVQVKRLLGFSPSPLRLVLDRSRGGQI